MKKRRVFLTLIGIIIAVLGSCAFADTSNTVYANVPGDLSLKYLNMLFGNVGNSLNQSFSGQTVGHMFYLFNQGILIACGIWVLIALASLIGKLIDGDVQAVSKQGKTFLSICLGVILIVPSPVTGYSTVQNIIMKVVVQGTKLANGIWDYTVDQWALSVPIFRPPGGIAHGNPSAQGSNYNVINEAWSSLWVPGGMNRGLVTNIVTAQVCYFDNLRDAQDSQDGLFKNQNQNYDPQYTQSTDASGNNIITFGYGCGSIKTTTMFTNSVIVAINQLAQTSKNLSCEATDPTGKKSQLCQAFSNTYDPANYTTYNNIASNNIMSAISMLMTSLMDTEESYLTQHQGTDPSNCKLDGVALDKEQCMQKVIKPQLKSGGWINAGAFYWLLSHGQSSEAETSKSFADKTWETIRNVFYDNQITSSGVDADRNKNLTPILAELSDTMKNTITQSEQESGATTNPVNNNKVLSDAKQMAKQWKSLICNAPMMGMICGDNDPKSMPNKDSKTANIESGPFRATSDFLNASLYNMVALVSNMTSQLNNPNIDPQMILMNSGLQMIATAAAQYQNYIILVLNISVMLILLAVGGASGACSFLCDAQAILLSAFMKSVGGLFKKLAMAMLLMGVMMAFYIPLYPWIVFTFAAIGWFIAVIQAMAAGPLICLGLTNPHGQDLSSTLRQSIMLLLSIFIRPALMVISLVIAMILSRILFYYMLQGLSVIMNTMFATNISEISSAINSGSMSGQTTDGTDPLNQQNLWHSLTTMQSHAIDTTNNMLNEKSTIVPQMLNNGQAISITSNYIKFILQFISIPTILALVSYMTYKIITHSYSLVFTIPTYVMKWIGGESAGESGSLQQDANASKDASQKGAKAGSGALDKSTKAHDSMQSAGVKATSTLASGAMGSISGLFGGSGGSDDDDSE